MMHQVAVRSLDEQHMPYRLVHSASGVAGLQSMLAAGLGVGCLCASAIGNGMMRLGAKYGCRRCRTRCFADAADARRTRSRHAGARGAVAAIADVKPGRTIGGGASLRGARRNIK